MGSRQKLGGDGLNELGHRLQRAFRLRPGDGHGADGANRESETNCLEHWSLPAVGATGCVDDRHPKKRASEKMC